MLVALRRVALLWVSRCGRVALPTRIALLPTWLLRIALLRISWWRIALLWIALRLPSRLPSRLCARLLRIALRRVVLPSGIALWGLSVAGRLSIRAGVGLLLL